MSEEIWKPVVGYEGLYEVSSIGRIKSLGKRRIGGRFYKEMIRKTPLLSHGYALVILTLNGHEYGKLVHRAVAEAFIPNVNNCPTVNHINGIRHDNRLENLEWATFLEQQAHARAGGRSWNPKGEGCSWAKLTEGRVAIIKEMYKSKLYSQAVIGKIFGVHQMTISKITRGTRWAHAKGAA